MYINNKPYVPVRDTFNELGFGVDYDNGMATAVVTDDKYTIKIPKNKNYFMVNDKGVKPDNPQKIVNERMYIPYNAVGIAIAAETSYDKDNDTAHINYDDKNSYINYNTAQANTQVPQQISSEPTTDNTAQTQVPDQTNSQETTDTFTTLTPAEREFINPFKKFFEGIIDTLEESSWPYNQEALSNLIGTDEYLKTLSAYNNEWKNFEFKINLHRSAIEVKLSQIEEYAKVRGKLSNEFSEFFKELIKLNLELNLSNFDGGGKEKFTNQRNSVIQYCNELLEKYFN